MSSLPDYPAALAAALESVSPLHRAEAVALADAGSRILAAPASADRDLPPFNRAQLDGYALRAVDFSPGRKWVVVGRTPAGTSTEVRLEPGECVAIATGAPLPADADTVIQHELSDRGDLAGGPVQFNVNSIRRGHGVHRRGADAREGQVLINAGTMLAAHHLGIAAVVGLARVSVAARPRAIVLTAGDEVVPVDSPILTHQIRNSNGPLVCELLRRFGAEVIRAEHLPDDRDRTTEAVSRALAACDLLITVGGVSAGERDFFPAATEACGVRMSLRGAALQPGKPVLAGRALSGAAVVGLPGNPVSVLACACLFVWPAVRVMLGLDAELPWRSVQLDEPVKPNAQRRAFRPAVLKNHSRVVVPSWAGSGDLAHTSSTHGLVELPVQSEEVAADASLRFLPWP